MNLISFDPGVTTGWAKFTESVVPTEFGEMSIDQLYDWLNSDHWQEWHPDQVVAEDYIIRPDQFRGFDHTWSRVPTLHVLGAIECWARRWGAPVHLSQPSLLSPAAKRFGMRDPKNRNLKYRNAISAMIHGRIYFEKRGANLSSR